MSKRWKDTIPSKPTQGKTMDLNFLGLMSQFRKKHFTEDLLLNISVPTGMERMGLGDLEIQGLIRGCGCSLWWEVCAHAGAEAAHIREFSLPPTSSSDRLSRELVLSPDRKAPVVTSQAIIRILGSTCSGSESQSKWDVYSWKSRPKIIVQHWGKMTYEKKPQ